MTISPQHQQAIDNLKRTIGDIILNTADGLVRDKDLGNDNFAPCRGAFEGLLDLFTELNTVDLKLLPPGTISEFQSQATNVSNIFGQVKNFSWSNSVPPQPPAAQAKTNLMSQVESAFNSVFTIIAPRMSWACSRQHNISKYSNDLREELVKQKEVVRETLEIRDSASKAAGEVMNLSARSGAAKYGSHFDKESDRHAATSLIWLGLCGICIATLLIIARQILPNDQYSKGANDIVSALPTLLPRLTELSTIGFILVWSSRNFTASRHNMIVNKHRQNALDCFGAFFESAHDQPTKSAVLLQATQCIFAPQDTAYGKFEPTSSGSISPTLEAIRGLTDTKH